MWIGNCTKCFLRPCFTRLQNFRSRQCDFQSIELVVILHWGSKQGVTENTQKIKKTSVCLFFFWVGGWLYLCRSYYLTFAPPPIKEWYKCGMWLKVLNFLCPFKVALEVLRHCVCFLGRRHQQPWLLPADWLTDCLLFWLFVYVHCIYLIVSVFEINLMASKK